MLMRPPPSGGGGGRTVACASHGKPSSFGIGASFTVWGGALPLPLTLGHYRGAGEMVPGCTCGPLMAKWTYAFGAHLGPSHAARCLSSHFLHTKFRNINAVPVPRKPIARPLRRLRCAVSAPIHSSGGLPLPPRSPKREGCTYTRVYGCTHVHMCRLRTVSTDYTQGNVHVHSAYNPRAVSTDDTCTRMRHVYFTYTYTRIPTNRGFNWARRKLMWTNFEALPGSKYFLQF